jgi:hypothetical protein
VIKTFEANSKSMDIDVQTKRIKQQAYYFKPEYVFTVLFYTRLPLSMRRVWLSLIQEPYVGSGRGRYGLLYREHAGAAYQT